MTPKGIRSVNGQPVARSSSPGAPTAPGPADTLARLNEALAQSQQELTRREARIAELEQQNLALHQRVAAMELAPLEPAVDPLLEERLRDYEKQVKELNSELLAARARATELEKQLTGLQDELRRQELHAGERLGGLREL